MTQMAKIYPMGCKGEDMTIKDLDKAVKLCKVNKELYDKFNGFISVDFNRIQVRLDAFVEFFNDFYIEENYGSYWKLYATYQGVKVMCLASYSEMLNNDKTKKYLKERLDG